MGEPEPMIEAPETPHVHHKHDHDQRWFDIAIALAVVLVSVGSLYVSLHTGHTMEKLVEQNSRLVRANSVPLLQFDHGNIGDDGKPEIYLSVRNVGTGPARIVWFEILQDGRSVRSPRDLLPRDLNRQVTQLDTITSGIAPSMMPAGEARKILKWKLPARDTSARSAWEQVDKARFRLVAEACYCSLFDECWRTGAQADIPKPVATCEIGRHLSDQG
jgi:hypothetical protein